MLAVLCGGLTVFVGGDHRRRYSFQIKRFGKSRVQPRARPERSSSGRVGGGSGTAWLASPLADRGAEAGARYFAAAASPITSALCFAPSTAIVVTSTPGSGLRSPSLYRGPGSFHKPRQCRLMRLSQAPYRSLLQFSSVSPVS